MTKSSEQKLLISLWRQYLRAEKKFKDDDDYDYKVSEYRKQLAEAISVISKIDLNKIKDTLLDCMYASYDSEVENLKCSIRHFAKIKKTLEEKKKIEFRARSFIYFNKLNNNKLKEECEKSLNKIIESIDFFSWQIENRKKRFNCKKLKI